jgi:sugar/nucleoside kinase (ribokinase family)
MAAPASAAARLPDVLCAGSVLWDVIGRVEGRAPRGADLPGRVRRTPGGVALNIAVALAAEGMAPALLGAVGRDAEGEALVAACAALGLATAWLERPARGATDRYVGVEDARGLVVAVADTRLLEGAGAAVLAPLADGRLGAPGRPWGGALVLDGNLPADVLAAAAAAPWLAGCDLRLASASPAKAARLAPFAGHGGATVYLNLAEAAALSGGAPADAADAVRALKAAGFARAVVTDGPRPAAAGHPGGIARARPPRVPVRRVTGAGDAFLAAHLAAERAGASPAEALGRAIARAARHVSSAAAPGSGEDGSEPGREGV